MLVCVIQSPLNSLALWLLQPGPLPPLLPPPPRLSHPSASRHPLPVVQESLAELQEVQRKHARWLQQWDEEKERLERERQEELQDLQQQRAELEQEQVHAELCLRLKAGHFFLATRHQTLGCCYG